MDTDFGNGLAADGHFSSGDRYPLQGRSVVLMTRPRLKPREEEDSEDEFVDASARVEELLYARKKHSAMRRWFYKR